MGFSILWIIVFHFCFYGNLFRISILEFLFSKGYIGVDVFLFLSAYGLCYSYERNTLKQYYLNRGRRLFPMYLLFVAVALFFFQINYEDSAVKLAICQCTGIASFRNVDFEWYIPALIVVYVVFPLLFKGMKRLYEYSKWATPFFLFVIVLLIPQISKVVFPIFAYRLPIIFLGILTFLAYKHNDERYLLSVYVFFASITIITKLSVNISMSLLIPLVLFSLGKIDINFPFNKGLSFIGNHSLEIYLAQNLALNHYYLNSDSPFVFKTMVALVIIIVGAFVLYYFQKGFYLYLSNKPNKEKK